MYPAANQVATSVISALLLPLGIDPQFFEDHLPRRGHVVRTLPNGRQMRFWSPGDDWVPNKVYWRGALGYEPETASVFFDLAREARVVVDVGAHVGYYAILAAHANPASRVFAFEPLRGVFDRLEFNVQLNGLTNVATVLAAADASSGARTFYYASSLEAPCSSSLSPGAVGDLADLTTTTVQTYALDEFLATENCPDVDLIKIDTEGTEPDVIRGLARTLRRSRPALICEVLPDDPRLPKSLEDALRPLGYRSFLLTAEGPMPQANVVADPTRRYRNHLFTVRRGLPD